MAEQEEDRQRDDLSEEASPHKLLEFRKKGQVAQSKELSGLLGFIAAAMALYLMSPVFTRQIVDFMRDMFRADVAAKLNIADVTVVTPALWRGLKLIALIGLPVALAGFALGVAGSFMQIGAIFSTEPLTPDLDKINPLKGLKRFFSLRHLYDGIRLIFKGVCLVGVCYLLVKARILESPIYVLTDPSALIRGFSSSGKVILMACFGVLLVFAGFDFWLQRWEFSKNVRLTKKEQKEEHKEHEGDPLIKARIRSVQREMARRRMMDAVKKADVIVTNPTHIAVALTYKKGDMDAPRVVAKGADFIAQKIKKIAADAGIPMVENVPLARTLYKSVKLGQYIPRALYQAVAEVLAFVYKLKNQKF